MMVEGSAGFHVLHHVDVRLSDVTVEPGS